VSQPVRRRLPGVDRIVAVASGKGGVGKTTIAVNLALALAHGWSAPGDARPGSRVGLFDADLYGPNVPWLLGVHRQHGDQRLFPIARADPRPYIQPLVRYGLKTMSFGMVVGEREAVQTDAPLIGRLVTQTLRDVVWGDLDYLFIDFPPGSGEPQQSLLAAVPLDGAVVVTTRQDLALLDAGRSLAMFHQAGVPVLGVVVNMSHLDCPHCHQRVELFPRPARDWTVAEGAVELLAEIPLDPAIGRPVAPGSPLLDGGPAGGQVAAIRRLARGVVDRLDRRNQPPAVE
jgi:ATP-binding protein involved in chromosome partitioning